MNCSFCQAENTPGATYCGSCGRPLAAVASKPTISPLGAPPAYIPPRPAAPIATPLQPAAPPGGMLGSGQPPRPGHSAFPPQSSPGIAAPALPPASLPPSPHAPPGGMGVPAVSGVPGALPIPKRRSPVASWIALALAAVVVVSALGGSTYLYLRHQQDLQTGHWISTDTNTSSAIPDGSFGFKTLGGQVIYTPPSNPPVQVTWQRYSNVQDGYSMDSPSNWQEVNTPSQGHAQWQICPPDTDVNAQQPGPPPCVNYGWERHLAIPSASDPAAETNRLVMVDGIAGSVYTEAGMGASISAIFPLKSGDVYLTADADSDAAMYAFTHMLGSIHFP